MLRYEDLKSNAIIRTYLEQGNANLDVLGFTDHSLAHTVKVAITAGHILQELGYSETEIELVKVAGLMHDLGNCINRNNHALSGALMAFNLLPQFGATAEETAKICAAIGHHDEGTGGAVDVISAALIIADKSDVRRNRVRNRDRATFDIHDRVNYAAKSSKLTIDREAKEIRLDIELDDEICSLMDYFEIFLDRMIMCRRAAEMLDCQFKMQANGSKIL